MTRTLLVPLHVYSRPGRGYGSDVYRVPADQVGFFSRIGWVLVHRASMSYAYMRAPIDFRGRNVQVSVDVPTRATIDAVAQHHHADGEPWQGVLCGWPARYRPRFEGLVRRSVLVPGESYREEWKPRVDPAEFSVGQLGVWRAHLRYEDPTGQPLWHEDHSE